MSDKRMFEFVEGSASKFWEIWRSGSEVRTRYGRIGSDGQTTVKDEGSEAGAEKLYNKLVKEKTGKGYVEQTGGAAAVVVAAPPAAAKPAAAPPPAKAPAKAAPKKAAVVDDDDDDDDDEGGASSGEVRYEVDEKFWAITLDGSSHTVRYGKIGTAGTSKTKDFDDDAAAKKDHDKLVKEKTGKGYELVGADDAEDEEEEEDESEEEEEEEESEEEDEDEEDEDEDEDDGEGWRRFEMDEKFWAIQLDGASHTVKYGKIGNDGTEKTKTFANAKAAEADVEKLIEEKTSKGYEEIE